jgi:hypothetical protein
VLGHDVTLCATTLDGDEAQQRATTTTTTTAETNAA